MAQVLLLIDIPQTNHIPRRIIQPSYLDTTIFELMINEVILSPVTPFSIYSQDTAPPIFQTWI